MNRIKRNEKFGDENMKMYEYDILFRINYTSLQRGQFDDRKETNWEQYHRNGQNWGSYQSSVQFQVATGLAADKHSKSPQNCSDYALCYLCTREVMNENAMAVGAKKFFFACTKVSRNQTNMEIEKCFLGETMGKNVFEAWEWHSSFLALSWCSEFTTHCFLSFTLKRAQHQTAIKNLLLWNNLSLQNAYFLATGVEHIFGTGQFAQKCACKSNVPFQIRSGLKGLSRLPSPITLISIDSHKRMRKRE